MLAARRGDRAGPADHLAALYLPGSHRAGMSALRRTSSRRTPRTASRHFGSSALLHRRHLAAIGVGDLLGTADRARGEDPARALKFPRRCRFGRLQLVAAVPRNTSAYVELAATECVAVLMKGSLHSDELLAAVVARDSGCGRNGASIRVYAMDVRPMPTAAHHDAAINIQPAAGAQYDICQNAIDLLLRLGMGTPLVAVLAAVERESGDVLDARCSGADDGGAGNGSAARRSMGRSPSTTRSARCDAYQGIVSPSRTGGHPAGAGSGAGNMLAKRLIYFAGATAAGLVSGARADHLTSRARIR